MRLAVRVFRWELHEACCARVQASNCSVCRPADRRSGGGPGCVRVPPHRGGAAHEALRVQRHPLWVGPRGYPLLGIPFLSIFPDTAPPQDMGSPSPGESGGSRRPRRPPGMAAMTSPCSAGTWTSEQASIKLSGLHTLRLDTEPAVSRGLWKLHASSQRKRGGFLYAETSGTQCRTEQGSTSTVPFAFR